MDSPIPPLKEQYEIIQNLSENHESHEGDTVYLIAKIWYDNWSQKAQNPDETANPNEIEQIDNSSLYTDPYYSNELRSNASYIMVIPSVWEKLYDWYGCDRIAKYQLYFDGKTLLPNPHPISLDIKYKGTLKSVQTCENIVTSTFTAYLRKLFEIPEETEIKLADWFNGSFYAYLDNDLTLKENRIYDKQTVVIDYKREDGEFKYSKPKTYTATPAYNNNYYNRGYYGYGYNYNYGPAPGPGIVGFSNLGNTCYFNSGTQCLIHSLPLEHIFLHTNWEDDINTTNPIGMKGRLARAFGELMEKVWSGESRVVAPQQLKAVMGEHIPQFSGYDQQDSQELITFMLDGLHEDLNKIKQKPFIENIDGDGTNDDEISVQSWDNFKKRNDSVIVDHFYGQYKSTLVCPLCHSTTIVFDPFNNICLPIPKPGTFTQTVKFIPYNFAEEFKQLTLKIPYGATLAQYSQLISEQIGRTVNVIVGSHTTYDLRWGIDEQAYDPYAFELPNDYQSKFFVPCIIKLRKQTTYYYGQTYEQSFEAAGPTLIAIDSKDSPIEDLAKNAEETFKSLWEPCDKPLPLEVEQCMSKLVNEPDFKDGNENKFKAKLPSYSAWTSTLESDFTYPYMSNKLAYLKINPKFTTEESGFNYNSLFRHFDEVPTPNHNSYYHYHQETEPVDITDCFTSFSKEDKLDEENQWYCHKCEKFVCANKKMEIWKVPECLILQLKRFISHGSYQQKDETLVNFPEILDVKPYIAGPQKEEEIIKFRLYAVSEHSGNLGFGHYTAHAKVVQDGKTNGKWYDFNDSSVSESSYEETQVSQAYVLFYQRFDPNAPVIEEEPQNERRQPIANPISSSTSDDDAWNQNGRATEFSSSSDEAAPTNKRKLIQDDDDEGREMEDITDAEKTAHLNTLENRQQQGMWKQVNYDSYSDENDENEPPEKSSQIYDLDDATKMAQHTNFDSDDDDNAHSNRKEISSDDGFENDNPYNINFSIEKKPNLENRYTPPQSNEDSSSSGTGIDEI